MYTNKEDEHRLFQIIGRNIKYYRLKYSLEKNKLTQEKLAELIGVSTALIGNLESERVHQGISVYTLWKLSSALEVPINSFFETRN